MGSTADAEAEEYIAARFREYGLQNVHMQPISLTPQWRPLEWSFTATGSGTTVTPTSILNQFGAAGISKTTATSARQWWINGSDRLASIVFDTYARIIDATAALSRSELRQAAPPAPTATRESR